MSHKKTIQRTTVVTYNGTVANRADCRKIGDNYYIIGKVNVKDSGQCYLINGTYYISNGPLSKVQWNYTKKIYTTDLNGLVYGWVDNNGTLGYFESNPAEMLQVTENGKVFFAMNEKCILKNFEYDFNDGLYKHKLNVAYPEPYVSDRRKPTYGSLSTEYYGFGEDPNTKFVKEVSDMYEEKNIEEHVFDKYFHNKTIGLEIETDGGWLPERYYYQYGALPLKDGSIYGTEITTFPYNKKYIGKIGGLLQKCSEYTVCSFNNSLHVNIGNIRNDANFRVALWMLYCRLQSEIESILPPYKRDAQYLTEKRGRGKDHCKLQEPLGLLKRYHNPEIEIPLADKTIRTFLNEGNPGNSYVRQDNAKWEQRSRYYALNMMPAYFAKAGQAPRIEFRVHSGTVNPIKTICWTLICVAITKFAEDNYGKIFKGDDKILLEDVLQYSFIDGTPEGAFLYKYVMDYVNYRAALHTTAITQNNVYGDEFSTDRQMTFKVNGKTILNYESATKGA